MKNNFTEREALIGFHAQHHYFGNQMQQLGLSSENIAELLPTSFMLEDLELSSHLYMNKAGCDYLRSYSEMLKMMGPEYFLRFFPLKELVDLRNQLGMFVAEGDLSMQHSFFQQVRPNIQEP